MQKTVLRSLIAVALVTGVGLRASTEARQERTISVPGYPAPGAPPTVAVTSTGAEPRLRIRYKATVGQKEVLLMTMAMGLNMSMEGMSMPAMDMPIMKLTAEMVVTGVAPNGDISYNIAFTGMTTEALPGMDPSLAAMVQAGAEGITALKGTAVVTDRGVSKSSTMDVDKITDPNLRQTLSAMSSSVESFSMPMPEEAVGVGAKWVVHQALKAAGAQTFQRVECELVSIDAQGATIRVKTEQTAPAQTVNNPALPAGAVVNVEKLTGSGSGTMAVKYNSLVPTSEITGSTSMAMAIDLGGQSQKMAVETKMKVSIAPKQN